MESLQTTLDAIRADFEKRTPSATLEIMHRSTRELIETGIHERAAGAGDEFPDFDLRDANGNPVSSAEWIGQEPVIFNFFRGFW